MEAKTVLFAVFGFVALLRAHGLSKPCRTHILTALSGEFMSARYPNSLYANGRRCRFVIKAEPGHFVKITFTKFELGSPHKGRRTDFVKIIDGFGKHSTQVVYYGGIRKTPFTFVSQTRRVIVILKGRNRGGGFHATYRQITPVLNDPMYCKYPVVKNGRGECKDDDEDNEKLYDNCLITCGSDFLLVGNKAARCNTDIGEWTDLPQCAMRPDILDICLKDKTNDDCLYSADMLADHYMKEISDEEDENEMVELIEELGDRMRDFDVEDVPSDGSCPSNLCEYNSSTSSFVNSCLTLSYTAQSQLNLNEEQRRAWMIRCFQCQNGCPESQIFPL